MTNQDQSPRREAAFRSLGRDGGISPTFSGLPNCEDLLAVTAHENGHRILDGPKPNAAEDAAFGEAFSHEATQDFLNSAECAAAESHPAWHHHFASDTVVGGTDWWTLGETGLEVSHFRGSFLVYVAGTCLGGIQLVFKQTPRQYFITNRIPFERTGAAYFLSQAS